jgi:hypothetical protein
MKNILQSHACLLFLSMTTLLYGAHNKPTSPSYLRDTPRSIQRRQFALEKRAALEKRDIQDISCCTTPPRSPKTCDSPERVIYSPISYVLQSPKNVTRSQSCHTPTRKARACAHQVPNKFPEFTDDTNDQLRASQEMQILQVIQEANELFVPKLLPKHSDFEPELSPKRLDRNKTSMIRQKINDKTELQQLCAYDLESRSLRISPEILTSRIL